MTDCVNNTPRSAAVNTLQSRWQWGIYLSAILAKEGGRKLYSIWSLAECPIFIRKRNKIFVCKLICLLSVCLHVCVSACLPVCLSFSFSHYLVSLFLYCLFVCLSFVISVCLTIFPYFSLSGYLSVWLSAYMSLYLSVGLFSICLSLASSLTFVQSVFTYRSLSACLSLLSLLSPNSCIGAKALHLAMTHLGRQKRRESESITVRGRTITEREKDNTFDDRERCKVQLKDTISLGTGKFVNCQMATICISLTFSLPLPLTFSLSLSCHLPLSRSLDLAC